LNLVKIVPDRPLLAETCYPFLLAPVDDQCGRAVVTGLHVVDLGGEMSIHDCPFPSGTLTAEQEALEFLFFDLAGCN
jgi:hypothetical protein